VKTNFQYIVKYFDETVPKSELVIGNRESKHGISYTS